MTLNFVLLFLLNTNNEVLMLRRINTPFCNNCYALPGTDIRPGETATQAIIREAKNSLGININITDLEFVHIMYRKCNDPEFFSCVFKLKNYPDNIINHDPLRHDDLKWFSVDSLPSKIVPAHKYTIDQIDHKIAYSEHGWDKC